MATATVPRHTCARCGRRMRRDQVVYSAPGRNYFCSPLWWRECQALVIRHAKAEA